MKRFGLLWSLVLCLLWQGTACAYFGAPSRFAGDMEHERAHVEMKAHHHDADGSLEFDDSTASLLHMMADCASTATLVPSLELRVSPTTGVMPHAPRASFLVSPYLEGPLRPPRSIV